MNVSLRTRLTTAFQARKRWVRSLYRLIGLGILVYLLIGLDYSLVWQSLLGIQAGYLVLSIVLVIPMVVGKAWRWQRFLQDHQIRLSLWQSTLIYLHGYGLGTVTPGQVGELIKIVKVAELCPDAKKSQIFGTIVNDRFYDLAGLALFGFPALLFSPVLSFPVAVILPLLMLAVVVSYNPNLILAITRKWFDFRFNKRYGGNLFISVAITALIIFRGILVFMAMGIKIPLNMVALHLPVINLISLLPISISGFGTREATMIYFFSHWSVSEERLVLTGLIMGLVFFLLNGLLGSLVIALKK